MRIKEIIYEYKNQDEATEHYNKMKEDGYRYISYSWKENFLGEMILEFRYLNKKF